MTQTTAQDTELDARPLSEIVESPRAVKALAGAGFTTLGDVRQQGLRALQGVRWVGEASISLLAEALGPSLPEEDDDDAEIEEGTHPLRLSSPYHSYEIKLLDSNRVPRPGGGHHVQRPIYLKFVSGEAALTKSMYLTCRFDRDADRIDPAMADTRFRWRRDAAAYLATVSGFNRDFHLRSD